MGYQRQPTGITSVLERYRRLADRRPMRPVPKIYFLAFVAGGVAGLALAPVTGWYWWSFGVIAVLSSWAFFLSTVFWPGGIKRARQ